MSPFGAVANQNFNPAYSKPKNAPPKQPAQQNTNQPQSSTSSTPEQGFTYHATTTLFTPSSSQAQNLSTPSNTITVSPGQVFYVGANGQFSLTPPGSAGGGQIIGGRPAAAVTAASGGGGGGGSAPFGGLSASQISSLVQQATAGGSQAAVNALNQAGISIVGGRPVSNAFLNANPGFASFGGFSQFGSSNLVPNPVEPNAPPVPASSFAVQKGGQLGTAGAAYYAANPPQLFSSSQPFQPGWYTVNDATTPQYISNAAYLQNLWLNGQLRSYQYFGTTRPTSLTAPTVITPSTSAATLSSYGITAAPAGATILLPVGWAIDSSGNLTVNGQAPTLAQSEEYANAVTSLLSENPQAATSTSMGVSAPTPTPNWVSAIQEAGNSGNAGAASYAANLAAYQIAPEFIINGAQYGMYGAGSVPTYTTGGFGINAPVVYASATQFPASPSGSPSYTALEAPSALSGQPSQLPRAPLAARVSSLLSYLQPYVDYINNGINSLASTSYSIGGAPITTNEGRANYRDYLENTLGQFLEGIRSFAENPAKTTMATYGNLPVEYATLMNQANTLVQAGVAPWYFPAVVEGLVGAPLAATGIGGAAALGATLPEIAGLTGLGALGNAGFGALMGQTSSQQLLQNAMTGGLTSAMLAPIMAGAPIADYLKGFLPEGYDITHPLITQALTRLPQSMTALGSWYALNTALSSEAHGEVPTPQEIEGAFAIGTLAGALFGGVPTLSQAAIAPAIESGAIGSSSATQSIANLATSSTLLGAGGVGLNYAMGSPLPAWQAALLNAGLPIGFEALRSTAGRFAVPLTNLANNQPIFGASFTGEGENPDYAGGQAYESLNYRNPKQYVSGYTTDSGLEVRPYYRAYAETIGNEARTMPLRIILGTTEEVQPSGRVESQMTSTEEANPRTSAALHATPDPNIMKRLAAGELVAIEPQAGAARGLRGAAEAGRGLYASVADFAKENGVQVYDKYGKPLTIQQAYGGYVGMGNPEESGGTKGTISGTSFGLVITREPTTTAAEYARMRGIDINAIRNPSTPFDVKDAFYTDYNNYLKATGGTGSSVMTAANPASETEKIATAQGGMIQGVPGGTTKIAFMLPNQGLFKGLPILENLFPTPYFAQLQLAQNIPLLLSASEAASAMGKPELATAISKFASEPMNYDAFSALRDAMESAGFYPNSASLSSVSTSPSMSASLSPSVSLSTSLSSSPSVSPSVFPSISPSISSSVSPSVSPSPSYSPSPSVSPSYSPSSSTSPSPISYPYSPIRRYVSPPLESLPYYLGPRITQQAATPYNVQGIYTPSLLAYLFPNAEPYFEQNYSPLTAVSGFRPLQRPEGANPLVASPVQPSQPTIKTVYTSPGNQQVTQVYSPPVSTTAEFIVDPGTMTIVKNPNYKPSPELLSNGTLANNQMPATASPAALAKLSTAAQNVAERLGTPANPHVIPLASPLVAGSTNVIPLSPTSSTARFGGNPAVPSGVSLVPDGQTLLSVLGNRQLLSLLNQIDPQRFNSLTLMQGGQQLMDAIRGLSYEQALQIMARLNVWQRARVYLTLGAAHDMADALSLAQGFSPTGILNLPSTRRKVLV